MDSSAAAIATTKASEAAASAEAAALWNPASYSTTAQIQAAFLRYDAPQTLTLDQKKALWAATNSMPRLSTGAALPTVVVNRPDGAPSVTQRRESRPCAGA